MSNPKPPELEVQYDQWIVIGTPVKTSNMYKVLCRCTCGEERMVNTGRLLRGNTKSCGCNSKSNRAKTNKERYGNEFPSSTDEGKARVLAGVRDKYGVDNVRSSSEVKEKIKQTILEKFGVENASQSEEIKIKKKETLKKNFGVEYPMHHPELKAKVIAKIKASALQAVVKRQATSQEKYGKRHPEITLLSDSTPAIDYCKMSKVDSINALRILRKQGEAVFLEYCKKGPRRTLPEVLLMALDSRIVRHNKYVTVGSVQIPYKPDTRIELVNKTIYINADGLYWHGEKVRSNNYHVNLRKAFEQNGLTILQFRHDELASKVKSEIIKSMILHRIGESKQVIGARKLTVRPLTGSEANDFFDQNHLMGAYMASTAYGLVDDSNNIISAMAIRQELNTLVIARFASQKFTSVRGGFSKLLEFCITKYKPIKVESFCDLRYATGQSYIKAGFVLDTSTPTTVPSFQWTDGYTTYNRRRCTANMDDRNLTEAQHAEELGWYKIYDAGQAKYIKHIKKTP